MATYKIVKNSGKTKSSLKRVIEYVGKEKENKDERVYKTSGINISEDFEKAYKDMLMTKEIFNQEEGRQYKHHIQSFKPGEVTPELAHKIAIEFAEKNFKNFDVFIATHIDKEHIHNHFIINSVCNINGLKLEEVSKYKFKDLQENLKEHQLFLGNLRKENDLLCEKYNLSVLKNDTIKSLNMYDTKDFYVYQKAINNEKNSYKLDLCYFIKEISEKVNSKKEFIEKMKKEKNIEVIWNEKNKNVTFKFNSKDKKNIRLSNLAKTYNDIFFTKEELEKKFESNKVNKKQNIYNLIKEKNTNSDLIEKYKVYISDSYKLALNKLSKNKFFEVDKEIENLKKLYEAEINLKNKEKILEKIKENKKLAEKIEKEVSKNYSFDEIRNTKEQIIQFYQNKIENLVEKNLKIYDNVNEYKEKMIQKYQIKDKEFINQTAILEKEKKRLNNMREKYSKIDIPYLALNNITKGKAQKITKEFYLLEKEKQKIQQPGGVINKIKNSLKINELEEKQKILQKNFTKLKEDNAKNTIEEIGRITKIINQNQNNLIETLRINNEIMKDIYSVRRNDFNLENNKKLSSGAKNIKQDEKNNVNGKSYNFDEELGEKKNKKGIGI